MRHRGQWISFIALGLFVLSIVSVGIFQIFDTSSSAAQLNHRNLHLSSNKVDDTGVSYIVGLRGVSTSPIGSIRLQLCSNDPFPGQPCTAPAGLDASAVTLVSQSGMNGFSLSPLSNANEIILTRLPVAGLAGDSKYELRGITNPSAPGTVYGRLESFASTDATGASSDYGGIAVAYVPSDVSIRTEVPPYLGFCIGQTIEPYDCSTASGNYIDFGVLRPDRTASGSTKLLVATNAEFGYTIRAHGPTLASGTNIIPALATPDVSRPGTSQFGLNLRSNSAPAVGQDPAGLGVGQPNPGYDSVNLYKFVSGDVLASYNHPDNYRLFTATYIVNVNRNQQPGVYVSTLTYIALASF